MKVKIFTEEQKKIGEAMASVIEKSMKTFKELGEAFGLVAKLHKKKLRMLEEYEMIKKKGGLRIK